MKKGKAAVFVKPYKFEITELPTLPVDPDGILIKITSSAICGTDLHYWRGELKPKTPGKSGPIILGHEMTGKIDSLGSNITTDSMGQKLKEGDRVAFPYFFPCRRCYNCMRLEFNNCPNRFRFRGSIEELPYCNGGFAEYYYLFPGHFVFKVPDEVPDEVTTSVNCALSQVIYGLQQGGMKIGDSVVIQGAGGLGINAAAAAAEMGAANIIVIDGIENRLELARQCGATHTININEITDKNARVEHVKKITNQRGADIGLEVVGYPGVVTEGISMLRNGGSYVEIGNIWDNSDASIDMSKLVWSMTKLIGIAHYDPYIIPVALDFLVRTQNKFPLTNIISHRFALDEISEAFEQSEWSGKNATTGLTRAILVP